jgi:hypothetical protein
MSASTVGAGDVSENIALSGAMFRFPEADETINEPDETRLPGARRIRETNPE